MRKLIILALLLVAIAGAAWLLLRDDGLIEQVTEDTVRTALLDNRVPEPMADCMAPRLVDRLSINQLRKLKRAAAQEGESRVPLSTGEALARLRRIDDREAVESVVTVAGGCGFELLLKRQ